MLFGGVCRWLLQCPFHHLTDLLVRNIPNSGCLESRWAVAVCIPARPTIIEALEQRNGPPFTSAETSIVASTRQFADMTTAWAPTDSADNNAFPTMASAFVMLESLMRMHLDFAVRCQITTGTLSRVADVATEELTLPVNYLPVKHLTRYLGSLQRQNIWHHHGMMRPHTVDNSAYVWKPSQVIMTLSNWLARSFFMDCALVGSRTFPFLLCC